MKILFLGSSRFSKLVLESMIENQLDIVGIITNPDREMGRGHKLQANEVKQFALEKNIKVLCSNKIKDDLEEIKNIDFDVSVVASFGQILPKEFLDYRLCLNVHPSKLPLYRGASPIQNAILNGDEKTAITIMKVGEKVDSGDIALQKEVDIIKNEKYSSLEARLAKIGGDMVKQAIDLKIKNKLCFYKQNDLQATYVKKFKKEDGFLDFKSNKQEIINKFRALAETLGTYVFYKQSKIKIYEIAEYQLQNIFLKSGEILDDKKHFVIGCNDGAIEILSCLSPSGKRMTGTDFLNGFHPQGEFINELC